MPNNRFTADFMMNEPSVKVKESAVGEKANGIIGRNLLQSRGNGEDERIKSISFGLRSVLVCQLACRLSLAAPESRLRF